MNETLRPTVSLPLRVYRALFSDIARYFPEYAKTDLQYLNSRIESEGVRFVLTTLPLLGKAVETSLIRAEPLQVPLGWSLVKHTRLPKFLNQLFKELYEDDATCRFNHESGYCEKAYWACLFIRQVTMAFSKTRSEATEENVTRALKEFEGRMTTSGFPARVSSARIQEIRRILLNSVEATPVIGDELKAFLNEPFGKHGPGAVAGRERGAEKWSFKKWPGLNPRLFAWCRDGDIPVGTLPEQPVARVVCVPKDFRGPRIICIEPKENQFAQQGLMGILYALLQRNPLSRRAICFEDVSESRRLCYNSQMATIDLKDASDLISLRLARILLPEWFFRLVTRYRTRVMLLPNGKTIKSGALATMGNATCFPLETMIFWAIALGTMIDIRDGWPKKYWKSFPMDIRVFGDDIIVPTWACDEVCHTLEQLGLRINPDKTCCWSSVRESCGEWVFLNHGISIQRYRDLAVGSLRDFGEFLDYAKACQLPALRHELFSILNEYQPFKAFKRRWNKALQRKEIRLPHIVLSGEDEELTGLSGLYAWHVGNDRTPSLYGARKRVKWGWVSSASYPELDAPEFETN